MALIGYARVSSQEQNLNRQIEQLTAFGVSKEFLFVEKASGKDFERPIYQEMKKRLTNLDILVVQDLSRLGRNRDQIMEEWEWINNNTGGIVVLSMPILDTRNKENGGVGDLIARIFLEIMSWMMEEERNRIRSNQRQGIEIARKIPGKYVGSKKTFKLNSPKVVHAFELLDSKRYTRNQIAELTGISTASLYRLIKERNEVEAANYQKENE
jgi:DNA invertase Pin-like site-specific DNA recombinase